MIHSSTIEVEFVNAHLMPTEYLRNNKSKEIKNIRCFPLCCQNGLKHNKSGFCGSSMQIILQTNEHVNEEEMDNLIVIGSISSLDPTSLLENDYKIDAFLDSYCSSQLTLVQGRDLGIYVASVENKEYHICTDSVDGLGIWKLNLDFNLHPRCWPYDWANHRFKKNIRHAFIVRIYSSDKIDAKTNMFRRIGRYIGPNFSLACKRRGYSNEFLTTSQTNLHYSPFISTSSDTISDDSLSQLDATKYEESDDSGNEIEDDKWQAPIASAHIQHRKFQGSDILVEYQDQSKSPAISPWLHSPWSKIKSGSFKFDETDRSNDILAHEINLDNIESFENKETEIRTLFETMASTPKSTCNEFDIHLNEEDLNHAYAQDHSMHHQMSRKRIREHEHDVYEKYEIIKRTSSITITDCALDIHLTHEEIKSALLELQNLTEILEKKFLVSKELYSNCSYDSSN